MIQERLRPILEETRPLAERFTAAGHRLYLVGGIVRDLLADRPLDQPGHRPHDRRPPGADEGAAERLGRRGVDPGRALRHDRRQEGDRSFEITTHRAEAYDPDSRKPSVEFSDAIEADLSRRDFTVNAMALTLPEPELVDPFDGRSDLLVHRRLRTPLSPEQSFTDDPLRMLRAARFIAGYGSPDDALRASIEQQRHRLEIVSAERIRDELDKLIVVDDPSAGLWFLHDTGPVRRVPAGDPALRLEQDPIHRHKDVLEHTIAVVANVAARQPDGSPNKLVRLAALLHDIGKPKTRSVGKHGVTFHHHEVVGARMARERLTALRYPTDEVEAISRLVFLHLRFHGYGEGDGGWTDSAVRRYVRDAGDLLRELNELTRCDCTTRNERRAKTLARRMDVSRRARGCASRRELNAARPRARRRRA